ncbi:MAG: hypothetical protein GEU28_12230 [Dehalococcoidia bacterium]|nr:hypothetical protein [Dehalococcoidia bacterium]
MADPPPFPDSGDDTGAGPGRGPTTGTRRWVPVVGIIIAIGLVLLFVILHLTGIVGPGAQ